MNRCRVKSKVESSMAPLANAAAMHVLKPKQSVIKLIHARNGTAACACQLVKLLQRDQDKAVTCRAPGFRTAVITIHSTVHLDNDVMKP